MEPIVPWLLLVMAGLIVACALMYSQLRQVESTARGRQSLVADELRDAEAALLSALERVRRMDQELASRESRLASVPWVPSTAELAAAAMCGRDRAAEATASGANGPGPAVHDIEGDADASVREGECREPEHQFAGIGTPSAPPATACGFQPGGWPEISLGSPSGASAEVPSSASSVPAGMGQPGKERATRRCGAEPTQWRAHAVELARSGASPRQVAHELGVPVGEVELVLALEQ